MPLSKMKRHHLSLPDESLDFQYLPEKKSVEGISNYF
jgi:hypothetical protein